MSIFSIIFISITLIYIFLVSPKICKKKIHAHINSIGGQVIQIEILSLRESLYSVNYKIRDEYKMAVVRFDITFEEDWKM